MPKRAAHGEGLMAAATRKICRCGDTEWPCFLVDDLCRMCQARRRDERRALAKAPRG